MRVPLAASAALWNTGGVQSMSAFGSVGAAAGGVTAVGGVRTGCGVAGALALGVLGCAGRLGVAGAGALGLGVTGALAAGASSPPPPQADIRAATAQAIRPRCQRACARGRFDSCTSCMTVVPW
jgi:hypothetical protein